MKLIKYGEAVKRAGREFDPSEIAKYLFELAQVYNDYYHQIPILKSDDDIKDIRLEVLMSVQQVIKNGLGLLGIKTVEKM